MGDNTNWQQEHAMDEADFPPPVDLSALRGTPRWDALTARVVAAAAPELARRAALAQAQGARRPREIEAGVFDLVPLLARAMRPALVAAAAALVVAVGLSLGPGSSTALAAGDDASGQLVSGVQVAEALRIGTSDAAWLAEGAAPSREALAQAVGFVDAGSADDGEGAAP